MNTCFGFFFLFHFLSDIQNVRVPFPKSSKPYSFAVQPLLNSRHKQPLQLPAKGAHLEITDASGCPTARCYTQAGASWGWGTSPAHCRAGSNSSPVALTPGQPARSVTASLLTVPCSFGGHRCVCPDRSLLLSAFLKLKASKSP